MSHTPFQEDHRLDLLVDGELSGEQYVDAIREMEKHPELWKPCALRFLEQQALRSEISAMRSEMEDVAPKSKPCQARQLRVWPWLLTAAAGFVLAFVTGVAVQSLRPTLVPWYPDVAQNDDPTDAQPGIDNVAVQPRRDSSNLAVQESTPAAVDAPALRDQLTVFVGSDDPQTTHVVDIPVRGWDEKLPDPLSQIPPDVLRSMNRLGEVRLESQLMPITTSDGRRILLPINRLEITPVSRKYH